MIFEIQNKINIYFNYILKNKPYKYRDKIIKIIKKMYNDFDENVKPEVITLSDLKGLDYKSFRRKYKLGRMANDKRRENPNKSLEEI